MKKCVLTTAAFCCVASLALAQDSTQSSEIVKDSTSVVVYENETANQARQESVYRINGKVDYPLTIGLAGLTIYGFTQAYSKETTSLEKIQSLRKEDINRFDRWAADVYSEKAAKTSDYIFYGSMPPPALLFFDKKMRRDAGKISLLYIQTMSVTGILYTGAATFVDRFRPYVYHPDATEGDKRDGNAKNAFFAGHVALVGTATFFTAKVYADYHPGSKWNKWLFTGAGLATATTAYLRHRGGRHFPTDILLGTAVGVASGVLIPHWHKNKLFKDENLSLSPFTGLSHGLALTYRIP